MSTTPETSALTWRKSSHSGGNDGDCIEISGDLLSTGVVPVRDSKDPEGPALIVSADAWTAFARAAGSGEFGAV